jgi:hypothetical protein
MKTALLKYRASLEFICHNNLRGKIRLMSDMTEGDIFDEIRSVFNFEPTFSFDILQPAGGKFKNLVVPSLSASYSWTASAVAGSSKSPNSDIKVNIISDFTRSLRMYMLYNVRNPRLYR